MRLLDDIHRIADALQALASRPAKPPDKPVVRQPSVVIDVTDEQLWENEQIDRWEEALRQAGQPVPDRSYWKR